MHRLFVTLTALVLVVGAQQAQAQQPNAVPAPWAYGFAAPPAATPPAPAAAPAAPAAQAAPQAPDPTRLSVPGSPLSFTAAEIGNNYGPADWFPDDHPAMPDIVAKGRREAQIWACGLCHYPNGKGRPENSSVAGLPYDYIVQSLMDFRNGLRRSADPRKNNTNLMINFAKAMTEDEIKDAARYFSSIAWTPWIKVVEATSVPKTRIFQGMFVPQTGEAAGSEDLGARILEVPEDSVQTERLRNPRSGFIAYVPPGSVAKGEQLARAGQCGTCHGADLAGLGPVPGIAGRSPSHTYRQMFEMREGFRKGVWSELMKPVVARLGDDDLLALSAYAASLPPRAPAR